MMRWVKKYIPQGEFYRNVLVLMTGTGISQLISLAVTPVLTRIYTPHDFGILAIYVSISSILAVLATGQYELAIILPKKDHSAFNVAALCISISFLVTLAILIFIFGLQFNSLTKKYVSDSELINWIFIIPASVFITGIYKTLYHWSVRQKNYRGISRSAILRISASLTAKLSLGMMMFGATGLILGDLIGSTIASVVLVIPVVESKDEILRIITWKKICKMAVRYKKFPVYSLSANLVNIISNQFPVLLLNNLFGSNVVGHFSFSRKIIGIPTSLVANSFLDVFREKATNEYRRKGTFQTLFLKTLKILVAISVLPSILLMFFAPQLFSFLFGEQWKMAGEYTQILSVMFFVGFSASALSYSFYIVERQHYDLVWQLILFFLTTTALFVGYYQQSSILSIFLFSVAYTLMYFIYLFMSYKLSQGSKNNYES
jgi:O-antigen/teichoic acid export membrane protein